MFVLCVCIIQALEHSERALSQSDSERASLETKLKASEVRDV